MKCMNKKCDAECKLYFRFSNKRIVPCWYCSICENIFTPSNIHKCNKCKGTIAYDVCKFTEERGDKFEGDFFMTGFQTGEARNLNLQKELNKKC